MWCVLKFKMYLGYVYYRILIFPSVLIETYADLWQWSVERYDKFWEDFFHFSDIKYSKLYNKVSE